MKLYHGSNVIVQEPKVLTNGHYKDFGYGFYCTNIEKQAVRWALTRKKEHVVNLYEYKPQEHPTHQIVFCTETALKSLTYERSYKV